MKKLVSLALILVMILSLAACGGKTVETTTEATTAPTESVSDSAQASAEAA